MNIAINPGKYVVAVSGGVDSVVLLHALVQKYQDSRLPANQRRRLIVAHFDHGIRQSSNEDRIFVQELAQWYGLPFVYETGRLSPKASEATARTARYDFLSSVVRASRYHAIITAHHADDALETAILNLLRGTGRKGMSSLYHNPRVIRPFLHVSKREIIDYAQQHSLHWREDDTNQSAVYTRNRVRHTIVPRLTAGDTTKLHEHIKWSKELNEVIDSHIVQFLHLQPAVHKLERRSFVLLPHIVAKEVLAEWLRINGVRSFNSKTIERLTVAVKTALPSTRHDITSSHTLHLSPSGIASLGQK